MNKQYSIAEARDRLPRLVHEVEEGTTVELTRRGKPVAIIVSIDDYRRMSSGRLRFWDAVEEFRRTVDLEELDVDSIFADVRDRSPGRDFSW